MKKTQLSDARNELAVLRDVVTQIATIRETAEDLNEEEKKFVEKEIKRIINKYKTE